MGWGLGWSAVSAPPSKVEILPEQEGGALPATPLREVTVLDINFERGLVAYRAILEPSAPFGDYDTPVINCRYPGMQAHPKSPVMIGVYDLNRHEHTKAFVVYREAVRRKLCSSPEEAARELAAAKAYLHEQGLDPEARPLALKPQARPSDAEFTVEVDQNKITLVADSVTYGKKLKGGRPPELRAACPATDDCYVSRARIRRLDTGEDLHVRYKRYETSMGGTGAWRFPQLWVKDGRAVVMELFETQSFAIGGFGATLHFSPGLSLVTATKP